MASNIQPIVAVSAVGGWLDAYTYNFAEGTSQTFTIGQPLIFSSGKLVIATSVTSPTIAGISLNKATGTAGTQSVPNCAVTLPYQEVIFQVSVDTTTTNNTAALATGKPSDFNIGTNYQMLLDSTSGNYYMGTGTGNPVFTLLSVDPIYAAVINGRVNVRILTSQTIWS